MLNTGPSRIQVLVAAFAFLALLAPPAFAADLRIHTGGNGGAYHGSFCPALTKKLEADGIRADCVPSAGTANNMARIADGPLDLGYGQLDVLAVEAGRYGGARSFTRIRVDDVRECLFAVAKNKELSNFGEVAVRAPELTFILPPENSGSAGTFNFLQEIDPYGLGQGKKIRHAANADEAIELALKSDDTVALFVQFPDPDNVRFKRIQELGGHIVPVIDRNILEQRIEGRQIYYAQETQVADASWLKSGTKVVTACTPLVLFTGSADLLSSNEDRDRHDYLVDTIRAYTTDDLMPAKSLFAKVLSRTRELSAVGADRFVELSEQARERAAPLLEKAKEAAAQAVDAAKPRPQE